MTVQISIPELIYHTLVEQLQLDTEVHLKCCDVIQGKVIFKEENDLTRAITSLAKLVHTKNDSFSLRLTLYMLIEELIQGENNGS